MTFKDAEVVMLAVAKGDPCNRAISGQEDAAKAYINKVAHQQTVIDQLRTNRKDDTCIIKSLQAQIDEMQGRIDRLRELPRSPAELRSLIDAANQAVNEKNTMELIADNAQKGQRSAERALAAIKTHIQELVSGFCSRLQPNDSLSCATVIQLLKGILSDTQTTDRILVLPCKLGTTVYLIDYCSSPGKDKTHCQYNCNSSQRERVFKENCLQYCRVTSCAFTLAMLPQMGKTCFLTRDEAKNRLKEHAEG